MGSINLCRLEGVRGRSHSDFVAENCCLGITRNLRDRVYGIAGNTLVDFVGFGVIRFYNIQTGIDKVEELCYN